MLQVTVPGYEWFDERTNRFGETKTVTLQLEHSLVSVARWESKWKKPFLGRGKKTREQLVDYIRCMTITQHVDPMVYRGISDDIIRQVNTYIEDSMTATWFNEKDNPQFNQKAITAEIIYYWMISLNIPFECQKWHLNRLMTLIRVCNIKNSGTKTKRSRSSPEERMALNRARRKQLGSRG